jgi:NAD(P)H dehydrogenase (quinone)
MSEVSRPRIAVIYYSATGNVAAMAREFAAAAEREGGEVRLRRVPESAPQEAVAKNPRWLAHLDADRGRACADLEDLTWADGLAFGCPTRFGNPPAQLKHFLDATGPLWAAGILSEKVATAFTSASTAHGGLESTILALNNHFYHWGSLIMPLGYAEQDFGDAANPYGASFVSRGGSAPDRIALAACRAQAGRLVRVARWAANIGGRVLP